MASTAPLLLTILTLTVTATISSATSTCKSQTFSSNRTYSKCEDLPTLKASIHWTYNSDASNISIAFVAPPASPAGWVAWALNPTGIGMVGAQALLAFKQSNGSMVVKTYNITAFGPIKESPIAFETSGLAAEEVGGVIQLFGSLKVPEKLTEVNQVWQVGPSVTAGVPDGHAFAAENLQSTRILNFLNEFVAASPAPAPAPEGAGASGDGVRREMSLKIWSVLVLGFVGFSFV